MAVQNPAIFLDGGTHPAEDVRRWIHAETDGAEGVNAPGDLLVSEKSATANMSVDIAAGRAYILGTESTFQGTYFVESRAVENLVISSSDPTNPRIDIVYAQVEDASYSGATTAWKLAVLTGTPAGSPSAPALPASSLLLATIAVATLASSIVDANITDGRTIFPVSPTISTFGAALIDDADAATALATLGIDGDLSTLSVPASTTISAFGATLVDDADAATALATLGVTAYAQTILDDADAATALATLGAVDAALFPSEIIVAGSDEVTAIVAATGVMQFRMPYAMTGTEIRASVGSAASTGTFTVDVNIGGATVLSTKVTIDATEKTSQTAATASVLSDTAWADDEIVTIDVDVDGDATATGLKVTLIGTRSV